MFWGIERFCVFLTVIKIPLQVFLLTDPVMSFREKQTSTCFRAHVFRATIIRFGKNVYDFLQLNFLSLASLFCLLNDDDVFCIHLASLIRN